MKAQQKETPVLMKPALIAKTIALIKTNTRRTTKLNHFNDTPDAWSFTDRGHGKWSAKHKNEKTFELEFNCPYGTAGDLLWVREKTREAQHYGFDYPLVQYSDESTNAHCIIVDTDQIIYGSFKSPLHMFKTDCRIWLKIDSIKIERLKDITEQDAIAEGVEPVEGGFKNYLQKPRMLQGLKNWPTAKQSFMSLWESINGVGSSDLNPWVWVISYKRIEKGGK